MKKIIGIVFVSCLILGTTGCFHEDEAGESSEFLYYGGESNPDAEVEVDGRAYARRAYFYCENCEEDYTDRYLEEGKWLWDQKTCRTEADAIDSSALYCLRDVAVVSSDVVNDSYSFSEAGCDFIVPKIGTPEFPNSTKLQVCEMSDTLVTGKVYCSNIQVALDIEEQCGFIEVDTAL